MLHEWLQPSSVNDFAQTYLGRVPYARPGAALKAMPWFDWGVLERLLASRPLPDILVASRGRLVDVPPPSSLGDVRRLMARELGIVLRRTELHDERLAELAAGFALDIPGEVHVQLYVTPAGTQTFGWHFDLEDVFIAQTVGVKDYFFRDNTVAREMSLASNPDFGAVRRETSPLLSARLIAGDWLYLPARWWHLVKCLEDSLSISIGVMPPEALRRAARIPAGWSGR
jgi:50S ribosomal protein L16 3-hydroxylase